MNKTQSSPSFSSFHEPSAGDGLGSYSSNQSFSSSSNESNESVHRQTNDLNDESTEDVLKKPTTTTKFECVEMNKKNYDSLVTNLPAGHRTILLIVNNENKKYLIDKFAQICYGYSNKSYKLKFAYLNSESFTAQKWLNEIMFERYKQVGENDEEETQSQKRRRKNAEKFSLDDENEGPNENLDEESKRPIEYEDKYVVLAINHQRKHYLVFNYEVQKSGETDEYQMALGFEENESPFENELANWLEQLTEGLLIGNKHNVKKWPQLG